MMSVLPLTQDQDHQVGIVQKVLQQTISLEKRTVHIQVNITLCMFALRYGIPFPM